MNKFTKKQKETAIELIKAPMMDRDVMPGKRRVLNSLFDRGMVKKGGENGRITWEANDSTCLVALSVVQYKFARMLHIKGEVDMLGGTSLTPEDFKSLYFLEKEGLCIMDQSLPSEKYKRKKYLPTEKLKKAFPS